MNKMLKRIKEGLEGGRDDDGLLADFRRTGVFYVETELNDLAFGGPADPMTPADIREQASWLRAKMEGALEVYEELARETEESGGTLDVNKLVAEIGRIRADRDKELRRQFPEIGPASKKN